MKLLMSLALVLLSMVGFCQENEHVKEGQITIYKTKDGRLFTRRERDSLDYIANQFTVTEKIQVKGDTVLFSLTYFEMSEVSPRYQNEAMYCGCGNKTKIPIAEIKKRFPFSESTTIKLVSFKKKRPDSYERYIPKKKGAIDLTKMFEVKVLNEELTEKIMDILVNFDNSYGIGSAYGCYEPRNGIVFENQSGKIIGHIEICFECYGYRTEPPIALGVFCSEKYDVLRGIFIAAGVQYGAQKVDED